MKRSFLEQAQDVEDLRRIVLARNSANHNCLHNFGNNAASSKNSNAAA